MKDRKHIIKASIIVLTFIFAISSKAQVPAFTSAEGFGKFATGGRGGQVVFVTTTEDYATGETPIEGSLRWALSQHPEEPITVIFRTSGIIKLKEGIKMKEKELERLTKLKEIEKDLRNKGFTKSGTSISI